MGAGAPYVVAEGVGFEPTVPMVRHTRSPGAPVQPLRHPSGVQAPASYGGGGGIRTHEGHGAPSGFRDRPVQPLRHPSSRATRQMAPHREVSPFGV